MPFIKIPGFVERAERERKGDGGEEKKRLLNEAIVLGVA